MTERSRRLTDRAWSYYKHADELQHHRHRLFLIIQGAALAGFIALANGGSEPRRDLASVVAVFGFVHALLWTALAWTVQIGMDFLNLRLREWDPVYDKYLGLVRPLHGLLSGRWVLNLYLPLMAALVWVTLVIIVFSTDSPRPTDERVSNMQRSFAATEAFFAALALAGTVIGLLAIRDGCLKDTKRWPWALVGTGFILVAASITALAGLFCRILGFL